MNGYFFAFLTAILTASAALIQKKLLNKEHASEFVAVFAIVNLVICVPLFFYLTVKLGLYCVCAFIYCD